MQSPNARWILRGLPWLLILILSTSLAYAVNAVAVASLPKPGRFQTELMALENGVDPCSLDADGALYAGWNWWVPAGRNAFCRHETYPGVSGRNEIFLQLTRARRLLATITYSDLTSSDVVLYCASGEPHYVEAGEFVSGPEAHRRYQQNCAAGAE